MTLTVDHPVTGTPAQVYRGGTAAVVAIHLLLWGGTMLGGWLYWDNFILQGQAARLGLSTDLLLNNHDGHVMPLTYAVVWLLQDLSGLNYALVAVSMLVGQAILITAAVIAMRTLLGRGQASVVALALLLLTPIMLPGFTWWSAALTLVPLMSCMLFATVAHVHFLRTRSRAALITTYALVLVSLGFFEKSLLIPFWLLGVTVLVDRQPGFWASLRDALRGYWRVWAGWTVLMIAYLLAFAQVAEGRTNLPTGPGQVIDLVRQAVFVTIAPALVGGPVHWTPVDYSASFADPPWWLILAGGLVLVAVVIIGTRRPGIARKAWLVAGAYLALDLTTFAIGRLGPNGDPGVIQAGRYLATAMIAVSVAVAATVATHERALSLPKWRWPIAGFVAVTATLALISSVNYAVIWSNNPAQDWVGTARIDLAAADAAVPLLDQDVPDFLLLPVTHPYNQASWFLAPLVNTPGFDTSTTRLQMLDNMGRLVPAQVDGAASLPSVEGCQQVLPGASLTMPLEHEVIPWLHTVAIDYVAQRAGLITVAIGTGDPVTTDVQAGAHQVYVRAEGGDASVTITSTDAQLCVGSLEVGRVLPSDLPYRGTADVTDALRDLQNGASG